MESVARGSYFHLARTFDVNSGQDVLERCCVQQVTHLLQGLGQKGNKRHLVTKILKPGQITNPGFQKLEQKQTAEGSQSLP